MLATSSRRVEEFCQWNFSRLNRHFLLVIEALESMALKSYQKLMFSVIECFTGARKIYLKSKTLLKIKSTSAVNRTSSDFPPFFDTRQSDNQLLTSLKPPLIFLEVKREEMLQVQQIATAYLNQFHRRGKIKKKTPQQHMRFFLVAIMCFIVCL